MTLLEPSARPQAATERALELIEQAGLKLSPSIRSKVERLHIAGRPYLLIAEDEVYTLGSEMAVLGATTDCEGVLTLVCLGETS